jgi:predicted Zn-dependent peptidase
LELTRAALAKEVARLGTDVSQAELDKAKMQRQTATMLGRQTTYQMAEEIEHFARFHAAMEEINTELDRYRAVTLDQLRGVARKYLIASNSSTLIVVPRSPSQAGVPRPAGQE